MRRKTQILLGLMAVWGAGAVHAQAARDYISIVGSSTVYPFATVVAERLGKTTPFKTPKIESTGSGGGIKLFCAGIGVEHPDIANASRAIKASEVERCRAHGVEGITEVKIGYDGIVLANARQAEPFRLTRRELFLALARRVPAPQGGERLVANPYERWSEIDEALPSKEIEVLGPPPTSGTRDAFVELAMEAGCKAYSWIAALERRDAARFKRVCHTMREDGAFIEAGENDNLIVRKLDVNPEALGIFGFSFLDQNRDRLQGAAVDGVKPTFEKIGSGAYPLARPLFFYVKEAHVGAIPGMEAYIAEFTSERAWGEHGYLADKGLIPMPKQERQRVKAKIHDRLFAQAGEE